ncbi:glutaredoxin-1 [Pristis pectinata]|uniref:glutaredoxin-1 n=1 Tax=Pristis pectinata TaxID=685728 RepID=UPI00223DAA58|nr:glutaredoxin-1 [Pristis pectinata]XP_051876107.1 glutaredoxin-1 [Pristis pectinata]
MAQEYVDKKIQPDKVVLFVRGSCPYCVLAKNVLENFDFKQDRLQIYDITDHPEMREIQNYLENITGARTVPRVFIGTECVGGGSDVKQLHDTGVLKEKLIAIGAISS